MTTGKKPRKIQDSVHFFSRKDKGVVQNFWHIVIARETLRKVDSAIFQSPFLPQPRHAVAHHSPHSTCVFPLSLQARWSLCLGAHPTLSNWRSLRLPTRQGPAQMLSSDSLLCSSSTTLLYARRTHYRALLWLRVHMLESDDMSLNTSSTTF